PTHYTRARGSNSRISRPRPRGDAPSERTQRLSARAADVADIHAAPRPARPSGYNTAGRDALIAPAGLDHRPLVEEGPHVYRPVYHASRPLHHRSRVQRGRRAPRLPGRLGRLGLVLSQHPRPPRPPLAEVEAPASRPWLPRPTTGIPQAHKLCS